MIEFFTTGPLHLIVAFVVVAILGSGRVARLVTYDQFPPTMWLRIQWDSLTEVRKVRTVGAPGGVAVVDNPWNKLLHCFWCFTPWAMAVCLGWFALSFVSPWIAVTWWVFWTWLAFAYVASMIVARDEPAE
jgi:hypothetical protein